MYLLALLITDSAADNASRSFAFPLGFLKVVSPVCAWGSDSGIPYALLVDGFTFVVCERVIYPGGVLV